MQLFMERGAGAFGFWLGSANIMNDAGAFLRTIPAAVKEKFAQVGKNIYSPPDENTRAPLGEYLRASTDRLFLEISRETGISPAPFWPDGAPYAVSLTHDIDRIHLTYQLAASRFRRRDFPGGLKALFLAFSAHDDPYHNFKRLTEYEEDWGVRSALYVLFERRRWAKAFKSGEIQHAIGVYRPEDVTEELRELHRRGFEIALHGSFGAFDNEGTLSAELERLSGLLGTGDKVFGVRNHYLQFDWESTPFIQKRCGVLYDSTIGFNFTCGFRCGTTFPFPVFVDGPGYLVELPLNIMDTSLKYAAPGSEAEVADRIAGEVKRRGGLLMINWHQQFCNKEIDRTMYDWVEKTMKRAIADGAFVAKPTDAAGYWQNRAGRGWIVSNKESC